MTTETTRPAPTGTIADLAPATDVLAYLRARFPSLPTPYVVLGQGAIIDLQALAPAAFESWRAALEIPPTDVELHAYGEGAWLHATTIVQDMPITLTGHGLPISVGQALTQQPPPGDAPATAPIVYTLAELSGGAA